MINYPRSVWTSANLNCLKTESFTYTYERNLDLSRTSIEAGGAFRFSAGKEATWLESSDPSTAWLKEARMAEGYGFESVVLFALDQFCGTPRCLVSWKFCERQRFPFEFNKAESVLSMKETGSRILFLAVDEFERLRGTNLAWFGLDELTYTSEDAWLRLEGRLRDPMPGDCADLQFGRRRDSIGSTGVLSAKGWKGMRRYLPRRMKTTMSWIRFRIITRG